MTRNGVVTAAEILADMDYEDVEYPLWTPGADPMQAPWRRRTCKAAACGTETAWKRHRRKREVCEQCDAAHALGWKRVTS